MQSKAFVIGQCVAIAVAAAGVVWAATAAADVIAYDGFNNGPVADLNGSTGGAGWTGPWADLGSSQITTVGGVGLAYPHLRTAAGAAQTPAGGSFDAATYSRGYGPIPAPANHLFISYLIRPDAGYGTYGGISFGGYSMIGVPLTMNTWGMRLGRYLFVDSGINAVQGQTALLVLELQVTGAQTNYSLYVNPDLTRGQPTSASATYTLGGATLPLSFYLMNDGGFTSDEFRVATTWNEAVPPPTSACFATSGPAPTTTCRGGAATFTVVPSGSPGPFGYHWFKGTVALADGPSGLGSTYSGTHLPTLTVSGAGSADAGFYFCEVSDSCGAVTSAPAVLSVCMADFNCNGSLQVQDIFDFLNAWFAGDPRADFNGLGGIAVQDIFDFLNAWFAGC